MPTRTSPRWWMQPLPRALRKRWHASSRSSASKDRIRNWPRLHRHERLTGFAQALRSWRRVRHALECKSDFACPRRLFRETQIYFFRGGKRVPPSAGFGRIMNLCRRGSGAGRKPRTDRGTCLPKRVPQKWSGVSARMLMRQLGARRIKHGQAGTVRAGGSIGRRLH